jgi:hypothetical protein
MLIIFVQILSQLLLVFLLRQLNKLYDNLRLNIAKIPLGNYLWENTIEGILDFTIHIL